MRTLLNQQIGLNKKYEQNSRIRGLEIMLCQVEALQCCKGKAAQIKLIDRFYSMVGNDFLRKLGDEVKRGDFPQEIIEQLKEKLLQEIEHPNELLRLKYRVQKKKEQEQRQLKQRQMQNLKNEEPPEPVTKIEPEPVLKDPMFEDNDDEYFNQDVKQKDEQISQLQVKQEEVDQLKEEDYDFEHDQEGIEKEKIIANANEKVEMYLIGQSLKKKYIAKTEKILIDLEDVFVKYRDHEQFYKRINCSFVKIQPEEVKAQMNGKQ